MIRFDYHTHHYRCGHASGNLRDYIESAAAQGITEIGVSDHAPAYWFDGVNHALPGTQMAVTELPVYVAEARELQSHYHGTIAVRVGIEADYIPGKAVELSVLLSANPLDYVLGSVHYVLGRSVFDRGRWLDERPDETFRAYYELVKDAARSGLFDILSHLSVVECYAPPMHESLQAELYPSVADVIAASGCAVEINTSGYRKMGADEPFPNRVLLRELIRAGVPLTFGSDAHTPEQVGFGRDRVLALLTELGVRTYAPAQITVRREPLWAYMTG
ncbi:MAG: histidinol-phosphatase [Armatimonadetes bacterium]|nr:histidinol-phosphatase [Armatimonadota bacterium]